MKKYNLKLTVNILTYKTNKKILLVGTIQGFKKIKN